MFQDEEIINEFVIESSEHLADIESQLLAIEAAGKDIDKNLVNNVFRAIHSVKGAAGFLGLSRINALAHSLENVLNRVRNLELIPTGEIVNSMLRSADLLRSMIDHVMESNETDVSTLVEELEEHAKKTVQMQTQAVEAAIPPTAAEPTSIALEQSEINPFSDTSAPESLLDDLHREIENAISDEHSHLSDMNSTESTAAHAMERTWHLEEAAPPTEPTVASQPAAMKAQPNNAASSGSLTPTKPKSNVEEPATQSKGNKASDSSVRVNVSVLDRLMNLAGELVLGRNQLLLAVAGGTREGLDNIAAKLDQVTSDLQETIMQTRMQPVGAVFGRFPRVVRDLSAKLGKKCELEIEGNEVEVDKAIIEAIGDPLTHLVRNSVDHGVETPAARIKSGKVPQGKILLRAFHQAGKVCIRIEDDGAGIDPKKLKSKAVDSGAITLENANTMTDAEAFRLIFMPGFSMATKVTDVSGRGVGMDVVKTNIEQMGGTVDVESEIGKGTAIHITLPLTLAIIPSMIVGCRDERYAIPQSNIAELVRVPSDEYANKIGHVRGAEVLRLRGALLPLIHLDEALGVPRELDRAPRSLNVLVLETGQMRYGVVVDTLYDSEEIVVKPLGKHLKELGFLAGATILGDGYVALILDVVGVANKMNLRNSDLSLKDEMAGHNATGSETHRLLLFTNHPEDHFAVPMATVARIERIKTSEVKMVGNQSLLIYRNTSLPLISLEDAISTRPRLLDLTHIFVIVFNVRGRELGLIAPTLRDIRDLIMNIDSNTLREPGVIGGLVVDGVTTRILDIAELVRLKHPDWFYEEPTGTIELETPEIAPMILVAEDSDFFRNQLTRSLAAAGYRVIGCVDGQEALEHMEQHGQEIDVIVTDIEMPRLDGLQFSQAVRRDQRFANLPIIAVTSLAGDDDRQRGAASGINDYQIKLDQEQLLASIQRHLVKC